MEGAKQIGKSFQASTRLKKMVVLGLLSVMILLNVAIAMAQVQSHKISELRDIDTDLDMGSNDVIATRVVGTNVQATNLYDDAGTGNFFEMGAGCVEDSYVSSISSTGLVTCGSDPGDISSVVAGSGLSGGGSADEVTLTLDSSCVNGQILKVNGGSWSCSADNPGPADTDTLQTVTTRGATTTHAVTLDSDGDGVTTVGGALDVDSNTLYVDNANNRVGIGTNTPAYALDVAGNAGIVSDLTVDTNTLYVDSASDNVGIGTLVPNEALTVDGNINVTGNITAGVHTVFIDGTNSRVGIGTRSPAAALHIYGYALGGNGFFQELDDSTFTIGNNGDPQSNAAPFYISTADDELYSNLKKSVFSGKVGIGTASPVSILSIDDGNGLSGTPNISFNGRAKFGYDGSRAAAMVRGMTAKNIVFDTDIGGGTPGEKMRITAAGDVGIGTTSPTQELDVRGNVNISGDVHFQNGGLISMYTDASNVDHIWHDDGANAWHFVSDDPYKSSSVKSQLYAGTAYMGGSGNNYFAGNVGIGTAAPTGKLDVDGSLVIGNEGIYDRDDGIVNVKEDLIVDGGDLYIDRLRNVDYIYGQYGTIARSTDEWLRLNDGNSHSNGVYTQGFFRSDGGVEVRGSNGAILNLKRADTTTYAYNDLGVINFDTTDSPSTTDASAVIKAQATTSHDTFHKGGRLVFMTKPNAMDASQNAQTRMTLDQDGGVYLNSNLLTSSSSTNSNSLRISTTTWEVFRYTSSRRYKNNISDMPFDKEKVLSLQPVQFTDIATGSRSIGLIAEDVAEIIPDLANYNNESQPEGVNYELLGLYLLDLSKQQEEELQEQRIEIDQLKVLVCLDHPEAEICV